MEHPCYTNRVTEPLGKVQIFFSVFKKFLKIRREHPCLLATATGRLAVRLTREPRLATDGADRGFNDNNNSHLPRIGRRGNTTPATSAPSVPGRPDSADTGQGYGLNTAPGTKFPVQRGSGQESTDRPDAPPAGLEFPGDSTKTSKATTTATSNSYALITSNRVNGR